MLKRLLQLLTLAALVNLLYQYWPRGEADELIPVMNAEGKYGYIDRSGRVRIEFEWESAESFDEGGNARVKTGNLYNILINRAGEVILPPEWDSVLPFNEFGLALVESNHVRIGAINRDGEWVIEPTWDYVGFYNPSGYVTVQKDQLMGVMDTEGSLVTPVKYRKISEFGPQGIAPASLDGDDWVLIDRHGNITADVAQMDYYWIGSFGDNGLAMAVLYIYEDEEKLYPKERTGWIGLDGKFVIEPVWHGAIDDFDEEGMVAVWKGKKVGWINDSGEVVIEPVWDDARSFGNSDLTGVMVGEKWGINHKWGVINRAGEVLVEPGWELIMDFGKDGIAEVLQRGKWGYIDSSGEVFIGKWQSFQPFNGREYTWVVKSGPAGAALSTDDGGGAGLAIINRKGEALREYEKGWKEGGVLSDGVHVVCKQRPVGATKKALGKLQGWITGDELEDRETLCELRDLQGNLIWSSTWLRKPTKAWLYLAAALLALFVVLLLGRRKKKMINQKS